MRAFTFPALVLAALTVWTAAAQTQISSITPLPGKTARSLPLPPYQSFCWFSADRGRWPGDGNRVLPWFGKTDPGNLLDSKPNPSTAKPGDHAMFALFHLKDGRFMAVLPVATPDSLAWLKLDGNGKFLVEYGTLGTSTVKPQPVLAVTAVDKDIYRACSAAWSKALSLPFIKGRTFPREKRPTRNRSNTWAGAAGSSIKRISPPNCLNRRPASWRPPPFPSGGSWWTTASRPRRALN